MTLSTCLRHFTNYLLFNINLPYKSFNFTDKFRHWDQWMLFLFACCRHLLCGVCSKSSPSWLCVHLQLCLCGGICSICDWMESNSRVCYRWVTRVLRCNWKLICEINSCFKKKSLFVFITIFVLRSTQLLLRLFPRLRNGQNLTSTSDFKRQLSLRKLLQTMQKFPGCFLKIK